MMFTIGIILSLVSFGSLCLGIYSLFSGEDYSTGKGFNRSGPFTWFFIYGLLAWFLLDNY
ncbi:hypothetical protein HMPREF9413_5371 [Paenibacillus sp. HGF7]|nr:hypothetical protein HMPREF9413_5371 [Paenibacillus sp. HGF7]EPD81301.1 hypothetical protein HMPREF1207_05058 [Paenibacillus sp. HGH0039]